VFIAHNPRRWFGRRRPTSQFIFFGPILWRSSPCGRLLPHHQQLRGRHLEFLGALLDRGGFIRRLDSAKPDGFGGDLVNAPGNGLRRFRLLGHAASIDWEVCTFNPAGKAPAPAEPPRKQEPGPHGARCVVSSHAPSRRWVRRGVPAQPGARLLPQGCRRGGGNRGSRSRTAILAAILARPQPNRIGVSSPEGFAPQSGGAHSQRVGAMRSLLHSRPRTFRMHRLFQALRL
jgi:hypothetical protein